MVTSIEQNQNIVTTEPIISTTLNIGAHEHINNTLMDTFYHKSTLLRVVVATLNHINERMKQGLMLPYFIDMDNTLWQQKPKTLDIYITDSIEARALNVEARGKDYATNILSYPSDLPAALFRLMPTLPLGELIICHAVIVREAAEQHKTIAQHISHLLVHGMLHLFGFDHEIGQVEQDEMEQFEIEILASITLPNPYLLTE